jgi:hypothetical protein
MDGVQVFVSRYAGHELDNWRTPRLIRRGFGDIVQFMKDTVRVNKPNVTELHIGRRLVYWKSHLQIGEGFDIHVLVIVGHSVSEVDGVRRSTKSNMLYRGVLLVRNAT